MPCTARANLVEQYAIANASLFDRVAEMTACLSYTDDTFDRGWLACEEALRVCNQIQVQIYEHLRDHRCALEIASRRPARASGSLLGPTGTLPCTTS